MRRSLCDQHRQIASVVAAGHLHAVQRRFGQRAVDMADQMQFEPFRIHHFGDGGDHAAAFVVRQRAQHRDTQLVVPGCGEAQRPWLGRHRFVWREHRVLVQAVALQAVHHILGRAQHPVRIMKNPGMFSPPCHDIPRPVMGPRDARIAVADIRFATVRVMPPGQQVDLRAERVIVVHGRVEWHAKALYQAPDIQVDAHQVVDVHAADIHVAQ